MGCQINTEWFRKITLYLYVMKTKSRNRVHGLLRTLIRSEVVRTLNEEKNGDPIEIRKNRTNAHDEIFRHVAELQQLVALAAKEFGKTSSSEAFDEIKEQISVIISNLTTAKKEDILLRDIVLNLRKKLMAALKNKDYDAFEKAEAEFSSSAAKWQHEITRNADKYMPIRQRSKETY